MSPELVDHEIEDYNNVDFVVVHPIEGPENAIDNADAMEDDIDDVVECAKDNIEYVEDTIHHTANKGNDLVVKLTLEPHAYTQDPRRSGRTIKPPLWLEVYVIAKGKGK